MNYEAMPQPCIITIETEKDGFKYTYKLNALSMMLVDNSKYLDYDQMGMAIRGRVPLKNNRKIEFRAECIDGLIITTELATQKEVANHRLLEVL